MRFPIILGVIFVVYVKVTLTDELQFKVNHNAIKGPFSTLLNSIVKVNEKRMKVMKQMTHLQDYDVIPSIYLRTDNYDENYFFLLNDQDYSYEEKERKEKPIITFYTNLL